MSGCRADHLNWSVTEGSECSLSPWSVTVECVECASRSYVLEGQLCVLAFIGLVLSVDVAVLDTTSARHFVLCASVCSFV